MDRLKIKMGITTLYLPMVDLGNITMSGLAWQHYTSGSYEWYCAPAGFFFDISPYSAGFPDLQYGGYHITLENGMYINCTKVDNGAADNIGFDGMYFEDGTSIGGISGQNFNNVAKNESQIFGVIGYYQNKEWIGIAFRLDSDAIIAIPFMMSGSMTEDSMQEPYDIGPEDPTQGGWGSWDRSSDEVTQNTTPSTIAPLSSGMTAYKISAGALQTFTSFLWGSNESLWTALWGRYANYRFNPIGAIIGCHGLPSDVMPTGTAATMVRLAGTFLGPIVSGLYTISTQFVDVSYSMDLPEFYGSWMDYQCVKIILHVPFCGICVIDPAYCAGGGITVLYRFDVLTGNCTAFVNARNRAGRTECIQQLGGNAAYAIAITGHDDGVVQALGSATQTLGGGIATAVSGVPMVSGSPSMAPQREQTTITGNLSGSSAATTNLNLYAEIVYTEPSNPQYYTQLRGRPADIGLTVGSFSGLTIFQDVETDGIARATDTEKREIQRLLKEGVII